MVSRSSYGAVYKALDTRDHKFVAIKVLPCEPDDEASLAKEIKILDECHNDYIVGYKGTWKNNDEVWVSGAAPCASAGCGVRPERLLRVGLIVRCLDRVQIVMEFCSTSLCDLMHQSDTELTEEQIAAVMKM